LPSLQPLSRDPGHALIVEDNVIIALEVETFLQDLGVASCFIAGTVENALHVLDARQVAFAIVDVDLGSETSEEVALALQERGLPFLFVTRYGESAPMERNFPDVPALMKPFTPAMLRTALSNLGID
jgi:two-component SAPR family response regulator